MSRLCSTAFQVVPVRRVQLDVGLSVVRGNNQALNEPLHDQPADRITASARYLFALGQVRGAYAQLGGTFVRRQDQVPSELVYDLPTAGYALAHVTVGVDEIQLGSTPVSISLAVRNLFATAYRDYLSRYRLFIDDPGRDVILRLRAMW